MRIDWTYDNCDEQDVPALEQHWERVQIELQGKLAELLDSPSELRIAVERSDSSPDWEIQAALHLPGHTLVAVGSSRRAEKALNEVLHGLAEQIDALEDVPVRVTQRREGLEGVVKLLEDWRSQKRSQPFLSFLAPLVESLGPYVQRELHIRQVEGTALSEEIDASDVLDEMLVQAWEQLDRRSKSQPFDLWLVQLADEVLNRLNTQVAVASIDEPSPIPQRDASSQDGDAWIEQVIYPETIDWSEVLPDGPGVETWDDLDLETKQTHLFEMLGRLERDRRQAFVLSVAHGFDVAEIADFQNRSIDEIETDIVQATAEIRRWFNDQQTPDREEPFEKLEMRRRRRRR